MPLLETTEQITARGTNFVFAREFVETRHGPAAWDAVIAGLAPETAAICRERLLVTESLPFGAFKELIQQISLVVDRQEEAATAEIYEYIAERSLGTLYKILLRLMRPSYVIGNYPMLWSRFFSAGKVEVPIAEAGHAQVDFEVPEAFLDWLRPACLGFSSKGIEMAGGRNLRIEELARRPLADGDWQLSFALRWDE